MTVYKTLLLTATFGLPTGFQAASWNAPVGGSTSKATGVAYEDPDWYRNYIGTDGTIETLAAQRNGSSNTDTLYLQKNSSSTSLTVTTIGSSGSDENGGSVAIASGDYVVWSHTSVAAYQWIRSLFYPAPDGQVSLFSLAGLNNGFFVGAILADTGVTNYLSFCGAQRGTVISEALSQLRVKNAGTFRNVRVFVEKNGSGVPVTLKSRVNGADGNISITIPGGALGLFEDTVNSDTLAVDDLYCFSASPTNTSWVDFTVLTSEYYLSADNGLFDLYSCSVSGQTLSSSANPLYITPGGQIRTSNVATGLGVTFGMECGAQKFRAIVTSNSCSATQTFVVLVNGVASTLTFDVGAGLTGEFIDDVHQISLTSTDVVLLQMTGGGTGSMVVQYLAMVIPGEAVGEPIPPEPPAPGSKFYYIERMDNRIWPTIESAWCVDAGLRYPMPTPDATLEATSATGGANIGQYNIINGGSNYTAPIAQIIDLGGTGTGAGAFLFTTTGGVINQVVIGALGEDYTHPQLTILDATGTGAVIQPIVTNYVTFSTNTSSFTASDAGSIIRMGGGMAEIIAVSDSTSVIANITAPITKTIPNDPYNTPVPATSGQWSMTAPTMTVSGLDHLEGLDVVALADGGVVTDLTVTDGSVTLPVAATSIVIGLPFVAQLQTMYMDLGGGPTVQTRRKNVTQAILRVGGSRAPEIGTNQPDAAAQPNQAEIPWGVRPYTGMTQIPFRTPNMPADQPMPLFSGDLDITNVFTTWDQKGQLAVQQTDPVPLAVTALTVWVQVGDSTGQ